MRNISRAFNSLKLVLRNLGRFRELSTSWVGGVREEVRVIRDLSDSQKQMEKVMKDRPFRLELGCGSFKRDGWIGIDIQGDPDIKLDLSLPWPFPDGSVAEIHSEHFLEHLEYPREVEHALSESLRVLKRGGMLSFSVPNLKPYLQAYCRNDLEFLREKVFDTPEDGKYDRCVMDVINWFALREGDHKYMYDDENSMLRLREAGFSEVRTRDFDPSRDYNKRLSSVYVQGLKP